MGNLQTKADEAPPIRRERRTALQLQPLLEERSNGSISGLDDDLSDILESEMEEKWENRSLEIVEQQLGGEKYTKCMAKIAQIRAPRMGDKTLLSMDYSKAKKTVSTEGSYIKRCNAVGAVGYAEVLKDSRIPANSFFYPGRRFRLRLRHSNLRQEDDAASAFREAAIKFADQNEDGPLDLILFTGRIAPARNCDSFMKIMKLKTSEDKKQKCLKDPLFYFALVDGLRRGPDSFSSLAYHSQIPYLLIPTKDGQPRLVRFRLIPAEGCTETGRLDDMDQQQPWETARRSHDNRSPHYLRAEFLKRIECEPIDYSLQVQIRHEEPALYNPQLVWDEEEFPWIALAKVKLTTALTCTALHRTYFNIVDKPNCLRFPAATSSVDFKSYHHVCCEMYTKFEIKHLGPAQNNNGVAGGKNGPITALKACEHPKVKHIVTVCAAPVKETRPRVDVFITLTGTYGRSTPRRLNNQFDSIGESEDEVSDANNDMEYFTIETEPVGELLAVTIAVRHRHLTDDWYLRYVKLTDPEKMTVRHFPCHSAVLSKVCLRPGNVSLPQNDCHEVLRQERLLELRDRQHDYQWQKIDGLPSQIRGVALKDIPVNEQLQAEKFVTLQWEVDVALGDMLLSMQSMKASTTNSMNMTPRQLSDSLHTVSKRRASYMRQNSAPVRNALAPHLPSEQAQADQEQQQAQTPLRKSNPRARMRWAKLKFGLKFIAKVRLPDGVKGDMCRALQDDLDFGRAFQHGTNPAILRRCTRIPDRFPVEQSMVSIMLDRGRTLVQEAEDGHIYIADYSILEDIPTYHKDADHRYIAAPMCLFYVRSTGDVTPIAIQLKQQPGAESPIWYPKESNPEDWLMAKLWVKCADFSHQFLIGHILRTHLLMEPFALATLRQLSVVHPVYKLLKPHFRYTCSMNTLLRKHILKKGGAIDKWTSLGIDGCRALLKRYFKTFSFDELDLEKDLVSRGVNDPKKLPNHCFRDDGLRLWASLHKYCDTILKLFYASDEEVVDDLEVQAWIKDLHDNGFPSLNCRQRSGLPDKIESIAQICDLCVKVIFTSTCYHNATHSEALDMYGHLPLVPAMMRQPPPNKKGLVNREYIVKTLPDQSPEAYYGSLANVLQQCKPDENPLGNNIEAYFVEENAKAIREEFRKELASLSLAITQRNKDIGSAYDCLSPNSIPNSVEPLPFLPRSVTDDVSQLAHLDKGNLPNMMAGGPSVPLMTLPLCMNFARNIGGKSFMGRRVSVNMFSKAMGGVGEVNSVSVPMQAIDRRKFSVNKMGYNRAQQSMMNSMYEPMY